MPHHYMAGGGRASNRDVAGAHGGAATVRERPRERADPPKPPAVEPVSYESFVAMKEMYLEILQKARMGVSEREEEIRRDREVA